MLLPNPVRSVVLVAIMASVGALIGGCLAAWGQQALVAGRNTDELTELSSAVVHRAELAIDYAVIAIGDLAAAGSDFCSPVGVLRLPSLVLQRGSLKQIVVLDPDGTQLCSTAAAGGVALEPWYEARVYRSRNDSIAIQPASISGAGLFHVRWQLGPDKTVVALLNVDMLMFDIFPSALRDHAAAQLLVGGRELVAQFGEMPELLQAGPVASFSSNSTRYPIEAQLAVSSAALAAWNRQYDALIVSIGAFLGALMALLATRLLVRPPDPVGRLRAAIQRGEIVPFYQPIFNLGTNAIVGCEVLARWIRPDGTAVFPDQFIPLAESSRLVGAMTDNLMAAALVELRPELERDAAFKVAFNIAPRQFVAPYFLDRLDMRLAQTGCRPAQIVLELTERTAFPDIDVAASVATEARRRGYRISLDDTGTGHNGLTHIQDLSPDVIKVDKHFVDAIGLDAGATAIIEVLLNLAKRLGATVVAEGVETDAQQQVLRQLGVEEGQGYLMARPMHGAAFSTFLAERRLLAPAAQADAMTSTRASATP